MFSLLVPLFFLQIPRPVDICILSVPEATFVGGGQAFTLSPDGKYLAAGNTKEVIIWDTATKKEVHRFEHAVGDRVFALAFSPRGDLLAMGKGLGTIELIDSTTWKIKKTLEQRQGLGCLSFSPDGETLASGVGGAGRLILWNVAKGIGEYHINASTHMIHSVSFCPDGQHVACDSFKNVRIWTVDGPTGPKLVREMKGHEEWVEGIAYSPDGKKLASVCRDFREGTQVKLWDPATGKELPVPAVLTKHGATGVCWSRDGKRLAIGQDAYAQVLDSQHPTRMIKVDASVCKGACQRVCLSPDGKYLYAGGLSGIVTRWRIPEPGEETAAMKELLPRLIRDPPRPVRGRRSR